MILWLFTQTGLSTTEEYGLESCDYLLSHPEVEDQAMLFYTALTRARNRLYLIEFEEEHKIPRKKGEKGLTNFAYRHLEQLDDGLVKIVQQIDGGKKEMTPQQHKARGVLLVTQAISIARISSSMTEIRKRFEQALKRFTPALGNDADLHGLASEHMEATLLKVKLRRQIENVFFDDVTGSYNLDEKFPQVLAFEHDLVKYMSHATWNTFMTDDFHEIISLVEEMVFGTPYARLGNYCAKLRAAHDGWYREICELSNKK